MAEISPRRGAVPTPSDYAAALGAIKSCIGEGRSRVVLAANSALVLLYWDIGSIILERQSAAGWGARIIDRLSSDLGRAYPGLRGFSSRNLKYMRSFAAAWPDRAIVQQLAAQLPWHHNCLIIHRIRSAELRAWYARRALHEGWSRSLLAQHIASSLHAREGKALTNFGTALGPGASLAAEQVFKDPYLFDFLGTADGRRERELEQALMDHLQQFLIELGTGFAFVGRQIAVRAGKAEFRVDLLFYHLRLRCFVVVELKATGFDPAFVGTLNAYLSAVDDQLRHADDKPSIGLRLCRGKERLVVEYALRDLGKPVGVAEWETMIAKSLPDELRAELPTVEELEQALDERSEA